MAWIVSLVLGLAWHPPAAAAQPPAASNWYIQILDSYADGDYQRFDRELHANTAGWPPSRLAFLSRGLEKAAPRWIAAASPEERDRRRLVVAAVSVELANQAGLTDWPQARALIEWACALIRKNARPLPAERTWHRAAVAVFEGAADAAVLQTHVAHALKRFPDDHRLVLARAMAAELRTWPDPRDGHTPRERNATGVGVTVTRFNEARRLDDVRAEAAVHLGFMALRNGDAGEALPYFREAAAASPDPFLLHLLHLFRGRALERLDRHDEAIEEYRAAVAAEAGQTARLALASALARGGRPQDGIRVVADAVGGTMNRVDPWIAYGRGDARMWPEILQRLRRELAAR